MNSVDRKPLVSVIIPAYNAEKTLDACLVSLQKQTFKNYEVIVVDDGSSDKTVELASKYLVKVIVNTHIKGPSGARNTGAEQALGSILAFTDSDCILPPKWLENILEPFNDLKVGAVGGGYASGIDTTFWQVFSNAELAFRRRSIPRETSTLVSNNFACRKQIFNQLGGFPEQYTACEDMYLSFLISRQQKVIWLADNGVIHHFKTSLKGYLNHQYYFGAESTRFLLQNASLLKNKDNHQGKTLYLGMIMALAVLGTFGLSLLTAALGWSSVATLLFLCSAVFLGIHWLVYRPFLEYMRKVNAAFVMKAYGVSLARDLYSGISAFDGLWRTWKTWSMRPVQ